MLGEDVYAELDNRLAPLDDRLRPRDGPPFHVRAPVHTLLVAADMFGPGVLREYGRLARRMVAEHGPLPFDEEVTRRVVDKLTREPVEDLRIDFGDGYGVRDDAEEDAAARATANAVRGSGSPPFFGIRIKPLIAAGRRRAIRTLDVFLDTYGPPPPGFVITVPQVSEPVQAEAMAVLCQRLERAYGLHDSSLHLEIQIDNTDAILSPAGVATVASLIEAAAGRCTALCFATYEYAGALGIAAEQQSLAHPAADHAKAVMQVAAARTGVLIADGASNVLPVGDTASVRSAWAAHAQLVRRGLERGFYRGVDLNLAQLPSRFGATFAFFRDGRGPAVEGVHRFLDRRLAGYSDDPAATRPLARFLLRGLDCGALDEDDIRVDRATLELI